MRVSLESEERSGLRCVLSDGAVEAAISVTDRAAASSSLLQALDHTAATGAGECFWPQAGGDYRWMLRREGDRVRIAVLWSTGALTGWEHVFSSETDFEAFAAEIRSQLAGLGPDGAAERVRFERSNPILCVENMQATLHFYVDLLGFENAAWGSDEFTCVSRDAAAIYLCRGGQGRPGAWVWIGVEDASRLHEEYVAKGVAIRLPPTNFAWALEIHVEDPDGNVLRMGSEPLPD